MATLWRVFPWDPRAPAGAPFSPGYLPKQSGLGRFDLPRSVRASAWYFAESEEHAVAEKLQHLRNRELRDRFLLQGERRLALAAAELSEGLRLADLCDPLELVRRGIAPDRLACSERAVTQAISQDLHDDPALAGFRWWSALLGEWHTVVLFSDRVSPQSLAFSPPEPLRLGSLEVERAAAALAIEIRKR